MAIAPAINKAVTKQVRRCSLAYLWSKSKADDIDVDFAIGEFFKEYGKHKFDLDAAFHPGFTILKADRPFPNDKVLKWDKPVRVPDSVYLPSTWWSKEGDAESSGVSDGIVGRWIGMGNWSS